MAISTPCFGINFAKIVSSLLLPTRVSTIHHEAACKRLVESVSQEVINVKRVKDDLREADAMMEAVTRSHVAYVQSGRSDSLTLEESMQWIQGTEDWHNAAKYQAQDKLEEMGALDQVEDLPSKVVTRTQLKRSKRRLQGTISGAITNTRRLVSQPMTQA